MGLPLQIVPGKSNKFFSIKHLNKEISVNLSKWSMLLPFSLLSIQRQKFKFLSPNVKISWRLKKKIKLKEVSTIFIDSSAVDRSNFT